MKKIIAALLLSTCLLFAKANEGIQFDSGNWNAVLQKAKKENKLVFIDVFTSWCGPCKKMAAEVFPQKQVAELFNNSFINYAIDAEKGEGVSIAKKFAVSSYPSYLFVNGDGQLVYRTGSYMTADAFMQEANNAMKEKDDPKPLAMWEQEYAGGKNGKAFLLGYMQKRSVLKLPSSDIVEQLFPLLTDEEKNRKEIISSLLYYDSRTEILPGGHAFNYLIDHFKTLDSLGLVKSPLSIIEVGINNYFRKHIVINREEKMLPAMAAAYRRFLEIIHISNENILVAEKEIPVRYYSGIRDESKLIPAVKDLVQSGIYKLDIAKMQAADRETYAKFKEPYLNGKSDSATDENFAMKNRLRKNVLMISVSYKLRDAAEAVYNTCTDQEILNEATDWAKQAKEWFPHFSNEAVYAGLLYKVNKKEEAIFRMQNAAADPIAKTNTELQKIFSEAIAKMKNNETPVKLWRR